MEASPQGEKTQPVFTFLDGVSVEEIDQPVDESAFADQAEELELQMQQPRQQPGIEICDAKSLIDSRSSVHQSVIQDDSVLMSGGLAGDIDQPVDDSDFSDEAEEVVALQIQQQLHQHGADVNDAQSDTISVGGRSINSFSVSSQAVIRELLERMRLQEEQLMRESEMRNLAENSIQIVDFAQNERIETKLSVQRVSYEVIEGSAEDDRVESTYSRQTAIYEMTEGSAESYQVESRFSAQSAFDEMMAGNAESDLVQSRLSVQSATINEMMAGSAESDRVESTYSGQFVSYEVIERSAESNLHEIHMADELGVLQLQNCEAEKQKVTQIIRAQLFEMPAPTPLWKKIIGPAIFVGVTTVAAVTAPWLLGSIYGITTAGPVAGGTFATIQAAAGAQKIAAGYSLIQSIAMGGSVGTLVLGSAGVGSVVGGGVSVGVLVGKNGTKWVTTFEVIAAREEQRAEPQEEEANNQIIQQN